MSTNPQNYGERCFTVPRSPVIRIFASKEIYKEALYISAIDDLGGIEHTCFTVTNGIKFPLQFASDDSGWATAPLCDIGVNRVASDQEKREGYIHIGRTKEPKESLFTIYVSTSADKLITKFGNYAGSTTEPEPFADGGENYFTDMSDGSGYWLWLYRLYAKP